MRWNSSNVGYPRPLRWIVALYGATPVTFTWAGVTSGAVSRGPRFADAAADLPVGGFVTFPIAAADAYFDAVAAQGVIVDRAARRQLVAKVVAAVAMSVGGTTPDDADLLDEVTDLVEAPQALLGSFEEKYLTLPTPVLIGVMKKHQRYFPVFKAGQMLPHFITVANAQQLDHPEVVVAGNAGVIRARYADAAYFYRQDTGRLLESYTPRLSTLTFHEKLGSMLDKVERLKTLAPAIGTHLGMDAPTIAATGRAAALAKSDLVTSMVVEMTSLQGIMGEFYAQQSGEAAAVAQAIREHYLPRFAGDANPTTLPGLALSLADKLDSLVGLFAVGAIPSGSTDPFGLRRAALGIVNNLLTTETAFNVVDGLALAAAQQPVEVSAAALQEAATFIERRLQGVLADLGYRYDVIEAVLVVHDDNPSVAQQSCIALQSLVQEPWWPDAFTAYARCARITRTVTEQFALNPAAYEEAVETQLHAAYLAAVATLEGQAAPAGPLGQVLQRLQAPIHAFFDKVLVNADDETLRQARLALVQRIAQLPRNVADLAKLQGF